jgi:hypothetical protein
LLLGNAASSDEGTVDLDEVDRGETHSLDSADTGKTDDLDEVDTGETDSLDAVDTGKTDDLDAVDTGESEDLDAADTGETESLDQAEEAGERAGSRQPPPSVPDIGSASERADAGRARDAVVSAQRRLAQADAAYSDMLTHGHPAGDARAAIVKARDDARRDLEQATARYTNLVRDMQEHGDPD